MWRFWRRNKPVYSTKIESDELHELRVRIAACEDWIVQHDPKLDNYWKSTYDSRGRYRNPEEFVNPDATDSGT